MATEQCVCLCKSGAFPGFRSRKKLNLFIRQQKDRQRGCWLHRARGPEAEHSWWRHHTGPSEPCTPRSTSSH